ncbi:MAG: heme-copper oxidase subunit III, partial [Planctomycetota bacterium]
RAQNPLSNSWAKNMMWIFIISDAIVFSSLLSSYGFTRLRYSIWPRSIEIFNIVLIAIMTFVLISSSATAACALNAAKHGRRKAVVKYLLATISGGLIFLGMQAYEWTHFIHQGARLFTNPWGVPQYSSFFFLITGFHGSHVFSGVIILLVVALRAAFDKVTAEGVEISVLYWHFVDLVWVFIFTLFYLI